MSKLRHRLGDATEWFAGQVYDLGIRLYRLAEWVHGDWVYESPPPSPQPPTGAAPLSSHTIWGEQMSAQMVDGRLVLHPYEHCDRVAGDPQISRNDTADLRSMLNDHEARFTAE